MKRLYEAILQDHFSNLNQMAFLAGPRQVGKTTIAKLLCDKAKRSLYLNWDYLPDRKRILTASQDIIDDLSSDVIGEIDLPLVVFDEIHKFKTWKQYLKGYFDHSKDHLHTLVTGSAKLDIYRRGGDSLMGRYFLYRIHPLSVAELVHGVRSEDELQAPKKLTIQKWAALREFGGYPDPYLKQDKRFLNRWRQLRFQQLFHEDIRSMSGVTDIAQIELLAKLLERNVGSGINYANLAKLVQVDAKTIKRWLDILASFYYCFTIRPWHKNVSRSLLKEPKVYLWDWSVIEEAGPKNENFVAQHLLKAVHYWTDMGFGKYDLYYLRDKEKQEVDFVISKDDEPWVLIEVKSSQKNAISKHLYYFYEQLKPKHAFQVVMDMPYIDEDCFAAQKPVVVPALTLLSQLV